MICCQGVQHGKKIQAQRWCLIVLFLLTALCVVRKKNKESLILSQIVEMQRSLVCLIQWTCLSSLLMCVTKTSVVLVTRSCAMNYLPCLFLVYLLVGAFSKCFCFFIFALYYMFSKQQCLQERMALACSGTVLSLPLSLDRISILNDLLM